MIKVTFEVETVQEAIALMEMTGGVTTISGLDKPSVEDVNSAIEALAEDENIAEAEAEPVRKRKSRVGKKASLHKHRILKKKSSSKKAPAFVSDEITDADLAKAASHGAEVITPVGVTAILTQFNVAHVSELYDDVRREFLDALDEAVEAEK